MSKLFFLLICLFSFPIIGSTKITDHLIDAEIEIAGGLRVRELIVVEGNLKSFSRTINYKNINAIYEGEVINFRESPIYNGYSLENVKLSAFELPKELDFNIFDREIEFFNIMNLEKKEDNYYTTVSNDLGATYNIFQNKFQKRFAFYIEYVISNVVVVHNDIDEIYYTFKNLDIGAENTFLRVILPYPTEEDDYNLWVHGPKGATLKVIETEDNHKQGFLAQFKELKTDISFRMSIPKGQVSIPIYLNHSEVDALNEILKAEALRIDKANNTILALNIIKYVYIVIATLYILGSLILLKYKQTSFFIVYISLGIVLSLFNYLFDYNIIYLYFLVILPICIKLIKKMI